MVSISGNIVTPDLDSDVVITGPSRIEVNTTAIFYISNYHVYKEYKINFNGGSYKLDFNKIELQAYEISGVFELTIEVIDSCAEESYTYVHQLTLFTYAPSAPVLNTLSSHVGSNLYLVDLLASGYISLNNIPYKSTSFEIASDYEFTNFLGRKINYSEVNVGMIVNYAGVVYVRARFTDVNNVTGLWCTPIAIDLVLDSKNSITTPVINSLGYKVSDRFKVAFICSSFSDVAGRVHKDTRYQIAKASDFLGTLVDYTDDVDKTLKSFMLDNLSDLDKLYARVRYKNDLELNSHWSNTVELKVRDFEILRPYAPTVSFLTLQVGEFDYRIIFNLSDYVSSTDRPWGDTDLDLSEEVDFDTFITRVLNRGANNFYIEVDKDTPLYVRARFKDIDNVVGVWSDPHNIVLLGSDLSVATPDVDANGTRIKSAVKLMVNTSAFVDIADRTHKSTRYQISRYVDYSSTLVDTVESYDKTYKEFNLTTILPTDILFIRAKHLNSSDLWSAWSDSKVVPYNMITQLMPSKPNMVITGIRTGNNEWAVTFIMSGYSSTTGRPRGGTDLLTSIEPSVNSIIKEVLNSSSNEITLVYDKEQVIYAKSRFNDDDGVDGLWSDIGSISLATVPLSVIRPTVILDNAVRSNGTSELTLKTNGFSDMRGASHKETQYQISRASNFTNNLVDNIDSVEKIVKTFLIRGIDNSNPDDIFYMRVRHRNSKDLWSEWSIVVNFKFSVILDLAPRAPSLSVEGARTGNSEYTIKYLTSNYNTASGNDWESIDLQMSINTSFSPVLKEELSRTTQEIIVTHNKAETIHARSRFMDTDKIKGLWSNTASVNLGNASISVKKPTVVLSGLTKTAGSGSITVQGSVYEDYYFGGVQNATHAETEYQISVKSDFSTMMINAFETEDKIKKTFTHASLATLGSNDTLYVRIRYKNSKGLIGEWSTVATRKASDFIDLSPVKALLTSEGAKTGANSYTLKYQASGFNSPTQANYQSTDFQIASNSTFTSMIKDLPRHPDRDYTLDVSTIGTVYARARFNDDVGGVGPWSNTDIKILSNLISSISIPNVSITKNVKASDKYTIELTGSEFIDSYNNTHSETNYQISMNSSFNTAGIRVDDTGSTNKTNKTFEITNIPTGTVVFYARIRYKNSKNLWSAWSPVVTKNESGFMNTEPDKAVVTIGTPSYANGVHSLPISISGYTSPIRLPYKSHDIQISDSSNFSSIEGQALNTTANPVALTTSKSTTIYARGRYQDSSNVYGPWSDVKSVKLNAQPPVPTGTISKPSVTINSATVSNGKISLNVSTSSFSSTGGVTHVSTIYQVDTTNTFSNLIHNSTDSANKLGKTITENSEGLINYKVRVKFIGSGGVESEWSDIANRNAVSGDVQPTGTIAKPSVTIDSATVANNKIKLGVSTSSFSSTGGVTHVSTIYQVDTTNTFSNLIHNSTDSANKLGKTITENSEGLINYKVRVKFIGSGGVESVWSDVANKDAVSGGSQPPEPKTIAKPSIISISHTTSGNDVAVTVNSTAFSSTGGVTHTATRYQSTKKQDYSELTYDQVHNGALVSYTSTGKFYETETRWYRVKYIGSGRIESDWSAWYSMTIYYN